MKTLIRPTWIISVCMMLAGAIPTTPWLLPLIGLALAMWVGWMGLQVLGSEDKDFLSTLERMNLAVQAAKEAQKNAEDAAARASKAVSDARSEISRLR